ncbi:MAG TPA: hypothetical protein VFE46_00630 [Pirellulales bacterium]|jgi:DNA-binding transcriptional regulator YhcF (GntR family)|nr:hypothetical protein [Pirellulales bacterium]
MRSGTIREFGGPIAGVQLLCLLEHGFAIAVQLLQFLDAMSRKQPKLRFNTLRGRAQQIVTRLMNSIAFHDGDCCSVEDFAREFKTTPGRLKTTLKRLEEADLVKVQGDLMEQVIPTSKLLQHRDRKLTKQKTARLIRQYKRGRYE